MGGAPHETLILLGCVESLARRRSWALTKAQAQVLPSTAAATPALLRAELAQSRLWELLSRARDSGVKSSALDDAMEGDLPKQAVISLIVEKVTAAPPSLPPDARCVACARGGDLAGLREAVEMGANLQAVGGDGLTALMHAADAGRLAALRFLVAAIMSDEDNHGGATPGQKNAEMLEMHSVGVSLRKTTDGVGLRISRAGVVLDVESEQAVAAGVAPGATICGVNGVRVVDKAGIIAELRPVAAGQDVTFLIRPDADSPSSVSRVVGNPALDVQCSGAVRGGGCFSGATALLFAARRGYTPEVLELLRAGAGVDLPRPDDDARGGGGGGGGGGATPLIVTAMHGHAATAAALLLHGADRSRQWQGRTADNWARRNGHEAVLRVLL
jgi:ankyrin repeat protein